MTPQQNVYQVPPFFRECIISNDMIYIIIKLLHPDPECRYQDIAEVKEALITLKNNILSSSANMKLILEHPIISPEYAQQHGMFQHAQQQQEALGTGNVSFRGQYMSEFSLKYLGKFLYGKKIDQLAINGGLMPLNTISMDSLTLLNLSN